MTCPSCGKELPEGSVFCSECGFTLPEEETIQPGKRTLFSVLIAAAILLLMAGCFLAIIFVPKFAARPVKVTLSDYVTVSFSGYDTQGVCHIELDEDALRDDFQDRLVWTASSKNRPSGMSPLDLLLTSVSFVTDKEHYTEGDTALITLQDDFSSYAVNFPDSHANNCVLVFEPVEAKAEGLTPCEVFDPFEGFEVMMEGSDGNTDLTFHKREDLPIMEWIYIIPDVNTRALHNGDTVTFSFSLDDAQQTYVVNTFGMLPSRTTYTYEVSGLPYTHYITDVQEIPSGYPQLLTDSVTAWQKEYWQTLSGRDFEYQSTTFLGYEFWTIQEGKTSADTNIYYGLFRNDVSYMSVDNTREILSIYYYARITDLFYNDGNITFYEETFDNFTDPSDDFEFVVQQGTLHIAGYTSPEEMLLAISERESDDFTLVISQLE